MRPPPPPGRSPGAFSLLPLVPGPWSLVPDPCSSPLPFRQPPAPRYNPSGEGSNLGKAIAMVHPGGRHPPGSFGLVGDRPL